MATAEPEVGWYAERRRSAEEGSRKDRIAEELEEEACRWSVKQEAYGTRSTRRHAQISEIGRSVHGIWVVS